MEVDVVLDGVENGNPQKFVYNLSEYCHLCVDLLRLTTFTDLWILQHLMQMSSVSYEPAQQDYFHHVGNQPGLYTSQSDNHPQVTEPQLMNYYRLHEERIDFKAITHEYVLQEHRLFLLFLRCSLLHWAASLGFPEVCQYLIEEKGVDVNIKNSFGVTPLHIAVYAGEVEVVDALLRCEKLFFCHNLLSFALGRMLT